LSGGARQAHEYEHGGGGDGSAHQHRLAAVAVANDAPDGREYGKGYGAGRLISRSPGTHGRLVGDAHLLDVVGDEYEAGLKRQNVQNLADRGGGEVALP
jgi:hypothetical protein